MSIPKIIHQTYPSLQLPADLQVNVDNIKAMNPGWEHRLYDNAMVDAFIAENFDADILQVYRSIDPIYGAARADFFRYLLIYKVGGVYLDIKSGAGLPLDDVIRADDTAILVKWENQAGEEHEGAGLSGPMGRIPGGEIQQWNIIAEPGHPFLWAAVSRVKANIERYSFWRHGTGRRSVIRLTGPIAYTLAIEPLKARIVHREVRGGRNLGLIYSTLSNELAHHKIFANHYSKNTAPIIIQTGWRRHAGRAYAAAKAWMGPLLLIAEAAAKRGLAAMRRRRKVAPDAPSRP